jgi:HPt (histidine-containing phosphotransfer) domain-containing protein
MILKPEILNEYFSDNTSAKLRFIDMFIQSIDIETDKLILALKKQDSQEIANAAHKLKSSFNYIDMSEIGTIYSTIEKESEEKSTNFLRIFNLIKEGESKNKRALTELIILKNVLSIGNKS